MVRCASICHSLCSDGLALFCIVMCLLLGSPIWYLLFHYCCRFHSRSSHLSQVGMGFRNWSEYNVVSFLVCYRHKQHTPVGVCRESRGVFCKGRHVLCVCIAVRRVQSRFLPLQTSCATLLPASIAQVLLTSRLAPHFTTTPSQQGGSQMKYKNVSELKKVNPFQVMEADHTKKASCC